MGGAAGHMKHPFDIATNGYDLHNMFVRAYTHVQNNNTNACVKIDGLNISVKLVNGSARLGKEFALDRGSAKDLDVLGVTKNDLKARFNAGHGMIAKGGVVLDILNQAIPKIKKELKLLGMWDDNNLVLNMEYVEGKSNVQDYGCNFLAIHGLLGMKFVTNKRRASYEVDYAASTMQSLINKLDVVANDFGFKVLGSVGVENITEPNFDVELNKSYTVCYSKHNKVTKTLRDWLYAVKVVPHNVKVNLKDGRKVDALSKEVFVSILEGVNLQEYIEGDYTNAVNGFVCYLATMKLGEAFLKAYTSKLGNVNEQEGLVVRNMYKEPFKITGSFIVRGMESCFQK